MALAAVARVGSPVELARDKPLLSAVSSVARIRVSRAQRTVQATYTGQQDTLQRPSYRPPPTRSLLFPNSGPAVPTPAPASPLPSGPPPLLRVVFAVPDCRLIFGEQLAVVGGCQEMGGWDANAAPRLAWQSGDSWAVEVRLPPGLHNFKLAVVRADGAAFFEDGPDRELEVPAGAAAVAVKSGTGLRVTCRYGNPFDTEAALASSAELSRLAPAPPKEVPAPVEAAMAAVAAPAAAAAADPPEPAASPALSPTAASAIAASAAGARMSAREALEKATRLMDAAAGPAPMEGGAGEQQPRWQAA